MTELIRLDAHDPLPESGAYALVLRRFGEDDPNATVTELIFSGPHGTTTPAHHDDGTAMTFDEAVAAAVKEAKHRGLARVYALDRTAGEREHEIIAHHGDHAVHSETLSDS